MIRSLKPLCRQIAAQNQFSLLRKTDSISVRFCQSANLVEESSAKSLNETLKTLEGSLKSKKLGMYECSSILFQLCRNCPTEASKIFATILAGEPKEAPPLLVKVVNVLKSSNASKAHVRDLKSSLKSMQILKFPGDSFPMNNVTNSLTWNCRSCPINHLVSLLPLVEKSRNDCETSMKLWGEILRAIEMRWVEITDIDIEVIATLLSHLSSFDEVFITRIEDIITKRAEEMSTEQVIQVQNC